MSYVIRPKWMGYFYCGPAIGFSLTKRLAVQYVSPEVARLAIEVVKCKIRKNFPSCKELIVEEYGEPESLGRMW